MRSLALLITQVIEWFWMSGCLLVVSCSLEESCSERPMEEHTEGVHWIFSRTDMQQDGYWHDHKWKREGLEQRRENMKTMKEGQ